MNPNRNTLLVAAAPGCLSLAGKNDLIAGDVGKSPSLPTNAATQRSGRQVAWSPPKRRPQFVGQAPQSAWDCTRLSGGFGGRLLLCVLCFVSAVVQAQTLSIDGRVATATGLLLTNAALRTETGIVALSDATGHYQFRVPAGWSGTVTVEQAGWAFTPASRSYTNLTGDVNGQDFTGTPDRPALGVSLPNGVPWLSWMAQTGQTYRVEVSRDLKQWDVLGEPVRVETNPAVRAVELEGYSRWFARLAQPGREYQMVTGQVALPPGSGLDVTSLQVLGGQNASGVTPEGGFSVFQPGSGPALVALMASNQPVLLGYVGGPGGGVSAGSTANWLLFQAVGGYRLPPETWAEVLGLIQSSPEAQGLAGVIRQCVATNPLALVQGEAAISNALWEAAGSLVKTNGSPVPPGRSRKHDPEELQAGSFVIEGPYPSQQTGLRCEHNPEGAGLVLVNDYRRHLMYFVYRVGYEDQQGVVHELPLADWEPVKGINDYLPGVNAVEGVLSSLAGVMMGQVAYGPSTSSEIRLTVQPEAAKKVFYRIVVTGPAGQWGNIPEVLRAHPLRGEWDRAYQWMEGLEFAKEYFVPVVFAGLSAANVADTLGGRRKLGIELTDTLSAAGLDIGTALRANQYDDALKVVIKELATNEDLREGAVKLAVSWGLVKATEAQTETLLKHVARILMIADAAVLGFDLALVSDHILRSYPLVYWDVTVLPPRVELEANERAVNGQEVVGLTATVTPMPDLTNSFVKFQWATSGQGKLRYQAGAIVKEGTDFEAVVTNGSCTVSYQNRSNATHGATETVRVAVKRVDISAEGTREVLVGEATNELFVINVQANLKPAETNLLMGEEALLALKLEPLQPKGLSNLVYTWTLDGSSGSLSGAGDLQRTYTANAHGWDVVKAAVKGDYGGKTYELSETKADVKVVPVRVSVRPQGQVMGQDRVLTLTAKVEPVPAEGQLVYRWQNNGPAGELIGGNDQQTSWPTNQFRSSATVEGTNRIAITAYLVTATETNELGGARTDIAVLRWPEWTSELLRSYRTAVGDWNGDGYPDLALAGWHSPQSETEPIRFRIYILTNNSGHGFTLCNSITTMSETTGLYPIDWDGDDILDSVRVHDGDGNSEVPAVQVFKGDGQGGFNLGASQPLVSTDGQATWFESEVGPGCVADVDEDGDLDLVASVSRRDGEDVENPDGGDYKLTTLRMGVVLWRNAANGSLPQPEFLGWTFAGTNENMQSASTTAPLVADVNGDLHPDLVFHFGGASLFYTLPPAAGAYFLLNDGHGHFAGTPTRVPEAPGAFAAEDFDGDATVDLWLGTRWQGGGAVLLNDGAANFTNQMVATLPSFPELPTTRCWSNVVAVTDINLDGHPDYLCQAYTKRSVFARPFTRLWTFFMVNDGHGHFTPVALSEVTAHTTGSFGPLVDMDRDGDLDLLYFDDFQSGDVNGVGVLLNNGDDAF